MTTTQCPQTLQCFHCLANYSCKNMVNEGGCEMRLGLSNQTATVLMQLPAMEYKIHLKEWFYYVACISELETRWLSSHSCYYALKSAWSPDQGCTSVFSQTNYETCTGILAAPLWSPHHPYYVQTVASPQLWMYCLPYNIKHQITTVVVE